MILVEYETPELLQDVSNYLTGIIYETNEFLPLKLLYSLRKRCKANCGTSKPGRTIVCLRGRINSWGMSAYSLKCPLQFEQLQIWSRKSRQLPGSLSEHLPSKRGACLRVQAQIFCHLLLNLLKLVQTSWRCHGNGSVWLTELRGCVIIKSTLFLQQHTCNKCQYKSQLQVRGSDKCNNGVFLLHSIIYDSNQPLNDFPGLYWLELFWSSSTRVEPAGANQVWRRLIQEKSSRTSVSCLSPHDPGLICAGMESEIGLLVPGSCLSELNGVRKRTCSIKYRRPVFQFKRLHWHEEHYRCWICWTAMWRVF